jgi:hypothetical protein
METLKTDLLEWAVASAIVGDGTESGDRSLVKSLADGVLVAVVDGLGHGPEAAAAAKLAIAIADRASTGSPIALLRQCHEELRSTRGVVLSLAFFDRQDRTMTWLGVGNVEGVLLRSYPEASPRREILLLRSGVVGRHLPSISASVLAVEPGDTLVLATDGLRPGSAVGLDATPPPKQLADFIIAREWQMNDDALVLVARYRGGGA